MSKASDMIIVALDVNSLDKVDRLVTELSPYVGCFKIGLELITSVGGPVAVNYVQSRGGNVFYDGKFNDIPTTVGAAAKAVAAMHVRMFNVHASSSIESMMAAVANKGQSLVLAVTVLTSFEENNAFLAFGAPSKAKVLQFARDAKLAGCDGVICSPQELKLLAKQKELAGLLKYTPGIRAVDAPFDDQNRTMAPSEAVRAGATAIVVGRPITNADNPVEAAINIAKEIEGALVDMGMAEQFGSK